MFWDISFVSGVREGRESEKKQNTKMLAGNSWVHNIFGCCKYLSCFILLSVIAENISPDVIWSWLPPCLAHRPHQLHHQTPNWAVFLVFSFFFSHTALTVYLHVNSIFDTGRKSIKILNTWINSFDELKLYLPATQQHNQQYEKSLKSQMPFALTGETFMRTKYI